MSQYHKKLAQKLGCKPCPFCGGEPKAFIVGLHKGGIRCSRCGACTKILHGGHYLTLEKARDYWNKRIIDTEAKND